MGLKLAAEPIGGPAGVIGKGDGPGFQALGDEEPVKEIAMMLGEALRPADFVDLEGHLQKAVIGH